MALIAIVHIRDHTTPDEVVSQRHTLEQIYGSRLVGLYEFPDRSETRCKGNCTHRGTGAWGRDPHGFMRCSICGSRNQNIRRWFVGGLFDWFGANLLGDKAPGLFRTPDGYGNQSRNDD